MPLDPLLNPKVKVVFIGTEPGKKSLQVGHYYANSRNSFYKDLKESGWTSRLYSFAEDARLLEDHNIGLFDVYGAPEALIKTIEPYKPPIVCFNSKGALRAFCGRNIRPNGWTGCGASAYAQFSWNPVAWALYDSSGIASRYHVQRIELLRQLLSEYAE